MTKEVLAILLNQTIFRVFTIADIKAILCIPKGVEKIFSGYSIALENEEGDKIISLKINDLK